MSLLSIISGAAQDIGLTAPSTVITNTDPTTQQLLQQCRTECFDLLRRYDWETLTKEANFTTVNAEQQVALSAIGASDFFRVIDGSMFNRTRHWQVIGPITPQEWQRKKASAAQVSIRNWVRIRGDYVLFFPNPTAGDSIYFEYISKNWCQSAALAAQADWAADTDTAFLNEEVIRLGTVWRFKKTKGLDYGEDFRTYELALEAIFGADGARASIDFTGPTDPLLSITTPEGNWSL